MSYLLLLFAVVFYAGNILIGKSLNDLSPFTITFFRLLIALIAILPLGYRSVKKHHKHFYAYKMPLFIMSVTGVALFHTFIYGALQFTSTTNVAVLETVIPVITMSLSAWLIKERLTRVQKAGVFLSMVGAIWVVLEGQFLKMNELTWNIGDGVMLGAILCWSIYSIYVKKYMSKLPKYGALFIMICMGVIILLPMMLFEWLIVGVPSLFHIQYIWSLLYLGIFPSVIALLFYNDAVQKLGASTASIFLNFLPIFTMIGAYFWLEESIKVSQLIGAMLVITGVIITTQAGRQKKRNKNMLLVRE